jgi:hypothetical protein
MNGVGDRNELLVEFARSDLLKQLSLRRHQLPVRSRRPQQRLIMLESSDARIIPAGADSRRTNSRLDLRTRRPYLLAARLRHAASEIVALRSRDPREPPSQSSRPTRSPLDQCWDIDRH